MLVQLYVFCLTRVLLVNKHVLIIISVVVDVVIIIFVVVVLQVFFLRNKCLLAHNYE